MCRAAESVARSTVVGEMLWRRDGESGLDVLKGIISNETTSSKGGGEQMPCA